MSDEEWTGWEPYFADEVGILRGENPEWWGWREVPGVVWNIWFGCTLEQTSQSEIAALGRFIKDRASYHENGWDAPRNLR